MSAPPRPKLRLTLPEVLRPADVTRLLGFTLNRLRRWDNRLQPFRTPGGHRRYRRDVVARVYEERAR